MVLAAKRSRPASTRLLLTPSEASNQHFHCGQERYREAVMESIIETKAATILCKPSGVCDVLSNANISQVAVIA